MDINSEQNYVHPGRDPQGHYGIRVSLPPGDTFSRIVGADWEAWHWFNSAAARDAAMADMAQRHVYSRIGDRPPIVLEPVER